MQLQVSGAFFFAVRFKKEDKRSEKKNNPATLKQKQIPKCWRAFPRPSVFPSSSRIKSVVPWIFRSKDRPGFRQEKKRVQQILVECLDYDIPRLDWGSGSVCG
jgi:hypothetical protein